VSSIHGKRLFIETRIPPFSRLVYPVPGATGGLGWPLTAGSRGRGALGPDFEWAGVDRISTGGPQTRRALLMRYPPLLAGVAGPALVLPCYAGIRPKTPGVRAGARFRSQGPARHGVPGLCSCFVIERPGSRPPRPPSRKPARSNWGSSAGFFGETKEGRWPSSAVRHSLTSLLAFIVVAVGAL